MSIFHKFAPLYFEKGYYPFSTMGQTKAPKTVGRSFETYSLDFELNNASGNSNIGIGVGKSYNVIAIDIDTPDKYHDSDIQKRIEAILPTSNYCRVGRPGRKLYFFKYKNEEQSITIKHDGDVWVELLTNNKFVIVPPSIHPDTKNNYVWTEDNILDCGPEDLPEINGDIYALLKSVKDILGGNIKENNSSMLTSGRNNKMVEVITAKWYEEKDITTILRESIEYDNQFHSPPLFSDANEFRGETDAQVNALFFITNIFKSLKKNRPKINLGQEVKFEIIETKVVEEIEIDYKKEKLPKFRGIAQEMFEHVYKTSPIPRTRFAVASTIATMGTILSNRVRCNGFYPNFYVLITALSAGGKDRALRFPYELFTKAQCKDLIGGAPESDSGILNNLSKQNTRLDVFDEASRLFYMMGDTKNLYAGKMADQYASLYTSIGKYFVGKTLKNDKIGECFSPGVNLLCALTVSDFQKSFNSDLLSKGVGGRFLFFPDLEYKDIQDVSNLEIPQTIIEFCLNARNFIRKTSVDFSEGDKSFDLPISSLVKKNHLAIGNKYRREGNKNHPNLEPIYNRAIEIVMKMAILDCVSQQTVEEITQDNLDWAVNWFESYMSSLSVFLDHNLFSSKQQMIEQEIVDLIKSKGSEGILKRDILRSYICRKNHLQGRDLKLYLDTIVEKEIAFMQRIQLEKGAPITKIYHADFVQK